MIYFNSRGPGGPPQKKLRINKLILALRSFYRSDDALGNQFASLFQIIKQIVYNK